MMSLIGIIVASMMEKGIIVASRMMPMVMAVVPVMLMSVVRVVLLAIAATVTIAVPMTEEGYV